MKIVVGMYDDIRHLDAALAPLMKSGLEQDRVEILSTTRGRNRETDSMYPRLARDVRQEDLRENLISRGVPSFDARFFDQGTREGNNLLVVEVEDERAHQIAQQMSDPPQAKRTESIPTPQISQRNFGDLQRINRSVPERLRFEKFEEDFRKHCESTFGEDFEHYENSYRYGHAHGLREEGRQYDWESLAPNLCTDYERRRGKGAWARSRSAIQHAFQTVRGRTGV